MPVQKECPILSVERLNADAISIWLECGELAKAAAVGQFVNIKCGEALLLRRPISICRVEDTRLNVVFEVRGEGTAWLAARSAGETLDVLGPLGHGFTYPEGKVLVVGGGIGVPPMLNTALRAPAGAIACLGFRSAERAMLVEEFQRACEQVYLASDDGTLGVHGFVADIVDAALTEHPEVAAVLACGPRIMLKTTYDVCRRHGVACQVSMEERMGCGIGACLVCACKSADGAYRHVCKDGPVFAAEEVCWDA
ncbi:MAG: dihydroorotate dehydrogenase electron transfer subunit [Oscillospiraceae bacterium]|nr:dihydroorotate dehydrogenase electron transfer subunit [Oscillospiraceae bacterium]